MATFSISLPNQIAKEVDSETKRLGFATRSEFLRDLVRKHLVEEKESYIFKPTDLNKVRFELARTKKYNQKFIESIVKGLSKSSLYNEN